MAYVKEGRVQHNESGYNLSYINHVRHPRGLMMKQIVTVSIHEDSLDDIAKFMGERVSFEIKDDKAIITGLSIRRVLRNCIHTNWTESTDGSQKECDYCGLTIPIK